MYRILLPLIVLNSLVFADTTYVNQTYYEHRRICLCDEYLKCEPNEYRFIDIKGYGLLYVSMTDQCTNKPCYGIFSGWTYGLSINFSDTMHYDTLKEDWYTDTISSGLIKVPHKNGDWLTETSNFKGLKHYPVVGTITEYSIKDIIIPVYESGFWSETGSGPIGSYWLNSFGNINEIFYVSRQGENTLKFRIEERSSEGSDYDLCIATDSSGNGKFKYNNTPNINKNLSKLKPLSHNIQYFNNRLHLPPACKSKQITIFNVRGQEILSQIIESKTLELKNLGAGVYHYVIIGKDRTFRGTLLKATSF